MHEPLGTSRALLSHKGDYAIWRGDACVAPTASEADDVLDRRCRVRRHDFARHRIVPVLELRLRTGLHDRLRRSGADLGKLIKFRCSRGVQIDFAGDRSGPRREALEPDFWQSDESHAT